MSQEILLQYLNLSDVNKDGLNTFRKQIDKVNKAYSDEQLNVFTYIICMLLISTVCLAVWLFYVLKYLISYSINKVSIKEHTVRYYTPIEQKRNEVLNELESYNSPVSKKVIIENNNLSLKEVSLKYLRKQLLINGNVLKGTVLRTTFPKVTGEEMLQYNTTGSLGKPFMTQRVTFGNEINKALKVIFPKLKNRKVKGQTDTYMVFEGDEVFTLETELRTLFMQPVTINLRAKV